MSACANAADSVFGVSLPRYRMGTDVHIQNFINLDVKQIRQITEQFAEPAILSLPESQGQVTESSCDSARTLILLVCWKLKLLGQASCSPGTKVVAFKFVKSTFSDIGDEQLPKYLEVPTF